MGFVKQFGCIKCQIAERYIYDDECIVFGKRKILSVRCQMYKSEDGYCFDYRQRTAMVQYEDNTYIKKDIVYSIDFEKIKKECPYYLEYILENEKNDYKG